MKKRYQGFTLVEIMIVVAIIAILAAVAIPNFIKYRADARKQACVSNMKQLQTAAESWRTSTGNATGVPSKDDLVGTETTKYIRKVAAQFTCPEGGDYTITAVDNVIKVTCTHESDLQHILEPTAAAANP